MYVFDTVNLYSTVSSYIRTVLHVLENLSGIFGFRSELGKWPYVRRLKICTPSGYAR